jgi:hypothetical protein
MWRRNTCLDVTTEHLSRCDDGSVLVKSEELPAAPSPLPPEKLRIESHPVTALHTKEKRSVLIFNRDVFAYSFLVLINYNYGVPSCYGSSHQRKEVSIEDFFAFFSFSCWLIIVNVNKCLILIRIRNNSVESGNSRAARIPDPTFSPNKLFSFIIGPLKVPWVFWEMRRVARWLYSGIISLRPWQPTSIFILNVQFSNVFPIPLSPTKLIGHYFWQ